jgi:hypothetical protein
LGALRVLFKINDWAERNNIYILYVEIEWFLLYSDYTYNSLAA